MDSRLEKPLVGNIWRQFKVSLVFMIISISLSLGVSFCALLFEFSVGYLWLTLILNCISIILVLSIWRKVAIAEKEMRSRYQKIVSDAKKAL